MRLNLVIFAALLCVGYALTVWFDQSALPPPPPLETAQKAIPSFSFKTLDGKTHNLTDFKDKTLIVNFWASWCAPCVEEFPRLLAAAHKFENHAVLIALSADINDKAITDFLHKMKIKGVAWESPNILIARDEADLAAKIFGTYKLPETFIIDPALQIRTKFIGADWTTQDLETAVKRVD